MNIITNLNMSIDTRTSSNSTIFSNCCATRNSYTGSYCGIFVNLDIMSNLNLIIYFNIPTNNSAINSTSSIVEFAPISTLSSIITSPIWGTLNQKLLSSFQAKSIRTNDTATLNYDIISYFAIIIYGYIRINYTIITNLN